MALHGTNIEGLKVETRQGKDGRWRWRFWSHAAGSFGGSGRRSFRSEAHALENADGFRHPSGVVVMVPDRRPSRDLAQGAD